ncbi:MAG TPA: hypothetical protein VFO85_20085 [Vicinamibacteria bacterium]|nr:hypothetical protein [Vicinamibacteria bacterium]
MRLPRLDHGHTLPQKALLVLIRLASGFRAPDVVKTLFYRKPFFGAHQNRLTQAVMRGPSDWSVGERELFAAYVSQLAQCPF